MNKTIIYKNLQVGALDVGGGALMWGKYMGALNSAEVQQYRNLKFGRQFAELFVCSEKFMRRAVLQSKYILVRKAPLEKF